MFKTARSCFPNQLFHEIPISIHGNSIIMQKAPVLSLVWSLFLILSLIQLLKQLARYNLQNKSWSFLFPSSTAIGISQWITATTANRYPRAHPWPPCSIFLSQHGSQRVYSNESQITLLRCTQLPSDSPFHSWLTMQALHDLLSKPVTSSTTTLWPF